MRIAKKHFVSNTTETASKTEIPVEKIMVHGRVSERSSVTEQHTQTMNRIA